MTVKDLILELCDYPLDSMVFISGWDGENYLAQPEVDEIMVVPTANGYRQHFYHDSVMDKLQSAVVVRT